eukprot:TRINITY_DN1635_c0_g16_i1.p4 TRINITY_DN1635_c0_g16~~TRINITY_DN1635_c0_g16_i1.p4  ORF type:complete len:150 (-),score=30.75 TRINITY_DN1635_c0_g16_i1:1199-1648(-)
MERYVDKKLLGERGFGKTYLAVNSVSNEKCVKKVIDTSIMKPSEYDVRAVGSKVRDKLVHENLVRCIGAVEDEKEQQYAIISEFIEGKSLGDCRGECGEFDSEPQDAGRADPGGESVRDTDWNTARRPAAAQQRTRAQDAEAGERAGRL